MMLAAAIVICGLVVLPLSYVLIIQPMQQARGLNSFARTLRNMRDDAARWDGTAELAQTMLDGK